MFNIFKKRAQKEDVLPYRLTPSGLAENNRLQAQEDRLVDERIESAAQRTHIAWLKAPINFDGQKFFIYDPPLSSYHFIYNLYDSESARHRNTNLREKIFERFKELRDEYEKRS